eukprot:m.179999 g.179999  ORF g.179999 m.179999 type:complete len:128 (+) comp53437_c0_seq1:1865-2248(+)
MGDGYIAVQPVEYSIKEVEMQNGICRATTHFCETVYRACCVHGPERLPTDQDKCNTLKWCIPFSVLCFPCAFAICCYVSCCDFSKGNVFLCCCGSCARQMGASRCPVCNLPQAHAPTCSLRPLIAPR